MVYHRFIENIDDLKILFDGNITQERIREWKFGQTEYLIESIGHPYHSAFFNKPKLVNKWRLRINDPNNLEEDRYREMCEVQMRTYLRSRRKD